MASGVSLGGYKASDGFSGSATLASNKVSVTGTFTKQPDGVGEKLGFPEEMNTGFFLPVKLTGIRGQAIKRMPDGRINVFGKTGDTGNTMNIILAVDPESPTIQFKLYSTLDDAQNDNEGLDITIDCNECEFNTPVAEPFSPKELEEIEAGDHKLADLVGEDYGVTIDEAAHTITATGELKKVDDYEDMFPGESKLTSYYLPVKLLGENGTTVKSTTLLGTEKTLTFGQTGDEEGTMVLIMAINPASPTRELTITPAAVGYSLNAETSYMVDASACDFEGYVPPVVNVTAPAGDKIYCGKQANNIQQNLVVGDSEITGQLFYFDSFPEAFPANESLQHGNYLVLDFSAEPADTIIKVELQGGNTVMKEPVVVDDGWCIFHVTSSEQKLHVIGEYNHQTYDKIYDLTNLHLSPHIPKFTSIEVRDPSGVPYLHYVKDLGDYVEDVTCTVDGQHITLDGGALKQFSKAYGGKNAYAVPFTMTGAAGKYVTWKQLDGKWEKEGTLIEDPYQPIVQVGPDEYTERRFKLWDSAEAVTATEDTSYMYVIDASKCTFIPYDDAVYLKLANGTIYDHNVEDFGNFDVQATTITGTAKYCENVTPFTEKYPERKDGYYLPLDIFGGKWEGNQFRVKWTDNDWSEWMPLDDKGLLLWLGKDNIILTNIETKDAAETVQQYTVNVEKESN